MTMIWCFHNTEKLVGATLFENIRILLNLSLGANENFQFLAGVILWRGFTIDQCINQCFGNKKDAGKGKQMPIHYGSKDHFYITASSPLGTQLPQGKFNTP